MNFPNTTPGGGLQPALRPAAGLPALPPDLSPFMDLAAADEIKSDVCEHGVDSRGVFVQHYGSNSLDA